MSSSLYDELRRMIDPMPLISVHEHQREDAHFRDVTLDFLLLNSYVGWTSPNKGAIKDRRGYLAGVRNHSYFVWMQRALSAIYGVGEITEKSWEEISGKIRQAHAADPNWHVEMLRKHGLYQKAIQDTFWRPGSDVGHPEMFAPTLRINAWVWCHHAEMKDHNGNGVESLCRWEDHFDDHLAAVERTVAAHKERGAVALKSAMAYERDINFKVVSRQEAARVHGKRPGEVGAEAVRAYQDFMFDYLCGLAGKYQLPLQNHTGLGLLAGGGSNPLNLIAMIEKHPATKFVLFHGGYPWVGEVGAMAHNYANVYPDLSWLPLISPHAAVRAIQEWLQVSTNAGGICWGGDSWSGEESVGASLALRHVLARALAQLVEEGYMGMDAAGEVAAGICHENAKKVYGV